MLTFVDVKFISIARVYREALEEKGLFRSANILQIADVVRRVVLLLFLLCFKTVVRDETSKMFRRVFGHFSFHNQNNSTSFPGFLG